MKKGDIFCRDCAVTGSNEGSPDDPKFALLLRFLEIVFPAAEKLAGKGNKYEGYCSIFQGTMLDCIATRHLQNLLRISAKEEDSTRSHRGLKCPI